ncbi:MAG: dihydroneopterin aldolase [Stappiaceae bacterium]
MDFIVLENLTFYAFHGLHEEEARLGQRFHIDLECGLDLTEASETDDMKTSVCYASLTKSVEDVVTKSRFYLIERLAGAIAEAAFAVDRKILTVKVRVHKPGAPLPLAAGRVSVQITRKRPSD